MWLSSSQFSTYENQNYHGHVPTHGWSFGTQKVDLSLNMASLEAIFMKNQVLVKWVWTQGQLEFEDHLMCIWTLDIRPSDDPKTFLRFSDRKKCCANFSPNFTPLCSKNGHFCLKVCAPLFPVVKSQNCFWIIWRANIKGSNAQEMVFKISSALGPDQFF